MKQSAEWLFTTQTLEVRAGGQIVQDYAIMDSWMLKARAADLRESIAEAFGEGHEATLSAAAIERQIRALAFVARREGPQQ